MVSSESTNRRDDIQGRNQWLFFVGDCPNVTTYINKRKAKTVWGVIAFLNALFRGYGQVVFANNPFSGALIMVALLWADISVGLKGIFSSVIALSVSIFLQHPKDEIENGLTVFNPLLLGQVCGAALPGHFGVEFELQHWFFLALGSIMTVYVAAALSSLLGSIGKYPIPCLALPFNVVQFLLFVAILHINNKTGPFIANNTSLSLNAQIKLPSTFSFELTSTKLDYDNETDININVTSEDPSSFASITTLSMTTSFSDKNISFTENMISTIIESNSTESYLQPTTLAVLAENETETKHLLSENMTDSYSNDTTSLNQTLERKKRETENQNSNTDTEQIVKEEYVDWGQVFAGVILSMTQVFGACHTPAAVLIYLAVLLYSPITAAFSLAGAILSTITGIGFSSAPYTFVYNGVWGFNGLLIAEAFSFFFVVTWQSTIMTAVSVFFGAVLQNLLMLALAQANMPIMSVPFNLTVILFLCLGPNEKGRGLIRPTLLSFPEKHRTMFVHQDQSEIHEKTKTSRLFLNEDQEEEKEKKAPLAEQEVV